MGLSDQDVREILRLIDESQVDELRLQMPGFSLHVRRGVGAGEPSQPLPAAQPATPDPLPAPLDPVAANNGALAVEAPMLGTFYLAEAPGEPPFVAVGDRVQADTVICLIEVMKLMNHIQAGVAGTVVEVLAANAELVEFGQPLFRVKPDA